MSDLQPAPTSGTRHFVVLDGLRGIAAIAVMALHLKVKFLLGYRPQAGLAVDFFFLLSGFVIAHAYWDRLSERRMGLRRFTLVRLVRFYPMMMLGNLLGAAYFLALGGKTATQVAGATVFALALVPLPRFADPSDSAYPLNGAFWSLTHELLANLAMAALAPMLGGGRRLLVVVGLAIAVMIAISGNGGLDASIAWRDQGAVFARTLASFAFGIALYRLLPTGPMRMTPGTGLLASIILAATFAGVLFAPILPIAVRLAIIFLVFPAVVLVAVRLPVPDRPARVLRWLGAVSFPAYALHVPFSLALDPWLTPILASGSAWGLPLMAIVIAAILALSTLALKLYDEPARAWLGQKLLRRKPLATTDVRA